MTAQRCPGCGRNWDGRSCLACGHVGDLTLAPSSSRARTPTALPNVKTIVPPSPSPAAVVPVRVVTPAERLQALWGTPVAFGIVFLVGFGVAFSVGAIATWRGHDPAQLLAEGRLDDALLVIDSTSSPSASWLRIKGSAMHKKGQTEQMLLAYQRAVAGDAVDDEALQHTLDALGDERFASLAVKTLEDWPGDEDIDARLLTLASDPQRLRRQKAIGALLARQESAPTTRLDASIRAAIVDTSSSVCEDKLAGINALSALSDDARAKPLLKKARAWETVLDQDNDVIFDQQRCLNRGVVKRAVAALAKVNL